ncbi:MAG: hypothetical protein KQI81_15125 [Deltaproteobacteria bacterium]|nr:hypothetical protein [Deltaproteobacteria bacterium]
MFKRLLMGLLAASLLVVWVVPEAHAIVRRYWYTVENNHDCSVGDLCEGATSVTDTLYGWDGTNATCEVTGRVICIPLNGGEICSDENTTAGLSTGDNFTDQEDFDIETKLASTLTKLDPLVGDLLCSEKYSTTETQYKDFIPNGFLAHSVYEGSFGNIDEETPPTTYELIESCIIVNGTNQYDCTKIWDSTSSDPPPPLPCCGVTNTLTVAIAPNGTGTVESSGGNQTDPNVPDINCPEDCSEEYNGAEPPYNGCPEVVLTAAPIDNGLDGVAFTGWDGGDCTGITETTCTTSAKGSHTITANFETSYVTLRVQVINGNGKGKAYIWSPRSDFDDPAEYYCDNTYENCDKKFGELCEFPMGTSVVIKRQGAPFKEWGGVCEGTPNSSDTCSFVMDQSQVVKVIFY